ncbi:MAG: restriction endonuclease subunit S [Terriglobales bacterium]
MSGLPQRNAGWAQVRLAEVCHVITDGTHKTPDYRDSGIRFISIKNIRPFQPVDWDSYVRFISKEEHLQLIKRCKPEMDDILFPRIGTLGFAKRIDFEEEVSIFVGLGLLKPDKAVIRPAYLEYYMNAPWIAELSSERANGSGRLTLPLEESREFPVLLPPLREQDRIVAEIEKQFTRLDAAVAALRRVQANLKRYRAAVLKAACEGRLVPTEAELAHKEGRSYETGEQLLARILKERRAKWDADQFAKMAAASELQKNDDWKKKKYKEPETPDASNLPKLREGWIWASPDQLSEFDDNAICAGPFGTIFKAKDFRPSGVPIIFLRHVAAGQYLTRKPGFMDPQKWDRLFRPYSVFGGELLITKLGEPPGVCAIYPEKLGPAMVTPDVIKMSVNQAAAVPRFLMHYFNSDKARLFSTGACFGTTRLRLTLPLFRRMPVALPPLAEQGRILTEVERQLSDEEALAKLVDAQLVRADRLHQSILKSAFQGRLVPQDSSDEPASRLLERIRIERETRQAQRNRAKTKPSFASVK